MKKYFASIALMVFVLSPALALADTLTPGVQAQGGTITEYSAQVNCDVTGRYGCQYFYYGAYGPSSLNLVINGTTINSQSFNMTGTQTVTADGAWSFNSGDDIEITDTEPCFVQDCPIANIQDGTISLTGSIALAVSAGGLPVTSFLPTSTAPTLMAYAGGLLTDPGTMLLFAMIVGVPLGFVFIRYLISLVPGEDKKRRRK
jgi:hypothetical protein